MSTGNAKHQAAVRRIDDQIAELQADIHRQLDVITDLATKVEDLVDTRQSVGLGFQTPEVREARARQDAADRAAARAAKPPTDASLGHAWMNEPASTAPGATAAPVTMPAASVRAEIVFTLQDYIRRWGPPAVAAAHVHEAKAVHEAQTCPWPRPRLITTQPASEGTVTVLADHLGRIVDVYRRRTSLHGLLRDLEHLEQLAKDVIHGPGRTAYPEPCPWCGHHSLAITPAGRIAGRDDFFVTCAGTHPCVCDDQWCPCRRNPIRHRHEWINSRHVKNPVDGRSPHALTTLITTRKEALVLETKALDAVARVHQLHEETPIQPWADECPHPDEHGPHWTEAAGDGGGLICNACDPLYTVCGTCRNTDGEYAEYPCPTVRALDLDQPATDPSTTSQS
ncbi:hypothetical protein GCM10028801_06900 [Nocardioides maradonensis]